MFAAFWRMMDEAFTYNKRINRLATVQEYFRRLRGRWNAAFLRKSLPQRALDVNPSYQTPPYVVERRLS